MRKIERYFIILFSLILIAFISYTIVKHVKKNSYVKKLLEKVEVSIISLNRVIPPEMIIEIVNHNEKTIGYTHVRLMFVKSKKQTICMVSYDLWNLRPGEKRRLLLKCDKKKFPSQYWGRTLKEAKYILQVFPEGEEKEPIIGRI